MRTPDWLNDDLVRLRLLQGLMLAAILGLGIALWRVQVLNAPKHRSSFDRQSLRRVRIPGARGAILDRRGVPLASSKPSYCIAVYVEELRQPGRWGRTVDEVDRVLSGLSRTLGIEKTVTRDDIARHISQRLPLPFLAWRNVKPEVVARWAETCDAVPGVDIHVEPVRTYPQHRVAAHVVGYVGRADAVRDAEDAYHYYMPEMEGKTGVEKWLNAELAGDAGGRLLRVDASGFKRKKEGERPPGRGHDVRLTLDLAAQRLAENSLRGFRGACVVLDPRNGDVLALASAPAFDPNAFVPSLPAEDWRRIHRDPERPLFCRALAGAYAPGSIFKPVVAIAALENRQARPDTVLHCSGLFEVGTGAYRCWNRAGHGFLDMRRAIEQSCNSYFFQLGILCGWERIFHMAAAMGLGQPTGIGLGPESAGLLPDDGWKQRHIKDRWRPGDTCNLSIGQGWLATTPIQMAVFAATLANGGTVYRPRLRDPRSEPEAESFVAGDVANRMNWSGETLETVRGGMRDVVHAEGGTGKRARVPGVNMAGKTGTAEHGPRNDRKKYGWMIAFAPYEAPLYAVALIMEDAKSGGITAAPRMRELMAGLLGVPLPDIPVAPAPQDAEWREEWDA